MRAPRITDRRWQLFRRGILLRDVGRCRYGYPACTTVATQVDHLFPRHLGGVMYDEGNCFSVCHSCHREKERLERAGEPIAGFLERSAAETRPVSAYTYGKTGRDRRTTLLGADYGRRPSKGAA